MKPFLIFFLLFIFSCGEVQQEEKVILPVVEVKKTDSLLLPLEPFFTVEILKGADFEKKISGLKKTISNDEADNGLSQRHKRFLNSYSEWVFSTDDSGDPFYIETKQGYKEYKNSDGKNEEKNIEYYLYSLNSELALIRYLKLASSGWEFLERSNNQSHNCLGFPVFSRDSSKILVASSSAPQRYDEKGLQYFVKTKNKWILKWKITLDEWFADDLHWISDSSIVCRKIYFGNPALRNDYDSIQYLQLTFKNP